MSPSDHGQVPGTYGALLAVRCLMGLDGCVDEECYCRCHSRLDEATRQRVRAAAAEAVRQGLEAALADTTAPDKSTPCP